ncbi:MAG: L-lysine 6-transaminase, partial [Nitrospinales bacterium]
VVDFEKSHGAYFYDALSQREFLDFYTFFASLPLGFNHPGLLDESFAKDMLRAGRCKPANSDILSVEFAEFVDTFHRVAAPPGFDHLFFISGGALAVENALKTAFDWKIRKNLRKGIEGKGQQVIHFKNAFHGRTGYTLSLTNTFDPHKTQYFPKFRWPRIASPVVQFPLTDANRERVERLEKQAELEIKQAFADNPNDIAAIIIEPIQGEGGDNHFRKEFFQTLRTLADENEAMLIFDEVQSGMGMTGKMWCAQHFEVEPDIFCFGKKSQVGGIMCNDRIQEVDSVFQVSGRINSTFGGSLSDMVRCRRYLEIMEEENLVQNAARVGRYFLEGLAKLAETFEIMSNLRGRGLMIAFDLPTSAARDKFRALLWENGCLVLACGERSIRLRPPLNLTVEEAGKGLTFFQESLARIYGRPASASKVYSPAVI